MYVRKAATATQIWQLGPSPVSCLSAPAGLLSRQDVDNYFWKHISRAKEAQHLFPAAVHAPPPPAARRPASKTTERKMHHNQSRGESARRWPVCVNNAPHQRAQPIRTAHYAGRGAFYFPRLKPIDFTKLPNLALLSYLACCITPRDCNLFSFL